MAFIEWSEKYSVGQERVDWEHQRLFKLIDELHEATKSNMPMLIDIYLGQLVQYCDYHFNTEEVVMKDVNYPEFATHKSAHDKLREQVLEFQKKYRRGEAQVGPELMNFLKNWLEGHILMVDTKLAAYLRKTATA